jgi:hypothetical protein
VLLPNLKADTHFLTLMQEFSEMENRIAEQRMRYNSSVSALNTKVKSFYGALVATYRRNRDLLGRLGRRDARREQDEAQHGAVREHLASLPL